MMQHDAQLVPISTLKPYKGNARTHNLDVIRDSLRVHGQYRPVVVRAKTREVLAGNGTMAAAIEEGWSELWATFVDVDARAAKRIVLVDNRANDLAGYDDGALATLLEGLPTLDGTGFDDKDLATLLKDSGQVPDDTDPIEPPEEPTAQLGDLWLLGEHRLLCGDTTNPEELAILLDGEKVDVVWTDPPYAIYGSSSGLSSSVTDDKIVRPFFREALRAAERHVKLFGHVYICCDWRSWPSWWEMAKGGQLDPKNLLVWDKGSSGMGNNWANTYELIGFFTHMPKQRTMSGGQQTGQRAVLSPNVIRANRPTGDDRHHNAAKPTDLIEHILGLATDDGQIVLDFFAGSGSTLIACENLGRRCYSMEIDPAYCDVIIDRWERHTGQTAQKAGRNRKAA